VSTNRDEAPDEVDDELEDELDDELDDYEDDDDFADEDDDQIDDDYDDDDQDEDEDEFDEVAADGNRIVGARSRAVVEYVTRRVAEDADAIEVDMEERGDQVTLLVNANPSDMGRLIGKRGRVIQALRRVTRAAGAAEGVKANVDILE